MRAWQVISFALFVSVVVLIRAEYTGAQTLVFVVKPLSTCLVLAIVLVDGFSLDVYRRYVAGGLLFSLAGDVFLMLPDDHFVAGLCAFLVAHVCYIAAFTRDGGFSGALRTALPLVANGAIVTALLWPSLGPLRVPVVVYMMVIFVMAWQALEGSRRDTHTGAWWAAAGALFFLASDSALGLSRFLGEFPGSRVVVLGTYFLAQWMIATSALIRTGSLAR